MIIKIERSGGITGMPFTTEFNSKELPGLLVNKVEKIIKDAKSSTLPLKRAPTGSADHYIYRISIQDGNDEKMIECDQYGLHDDLKSLIKYAESLRR